MGFQLTASYEPYNYGPPYFHVYRTRTTTNTLISVILPKNMGATVDGVIEVMIGRHADLSDGHIYVAHSPADYNTFRINLTQKLGSADHYYIQVAMRTSEKFNITLEVDDTRGI